MKLQTNLDHLRSLIEDNEEAIEFLDTIESQIDELFDECNDAESAVKELDDKISELEDELKTTKPAGDEIRTSLGSVYIFNEKGNLKLREHIDSFSQLIAAI